MSDRDDAQAGIDLQKSKEGIQDSIPPASQADDTLQPLLNAAAMRDEVAEPKESAIFERGYGGGIANFGSPVLDIANIEIYNDSADIIKLSDTKIRLNTGFKYKIQAFLNCTCVTNSSFTDFQIFDASNIEFIGNKGTVILTDNIGNSGSTIGCTAYIQKLSNVEFEVQFAGGDEISGYNLVLIIEKM